VIRFAWLQSRMQTLIAAALLIALALAAAITGVQLSHLYNDLVAHCRTGCDLATTRFLSHDKFMDQTLDILARAVPALLGIFWGAPLVAREFETGTDRLAWTQGVSRSRWLITKLSLGGLATAAPATRSGPTRTRCSTGATSHPSPTPCSPSQSARSSAPSCGGPCSRWRRPSACSCLLASP
jgi:hypothetical protein